MIVSFSEITTVPTGRYNSSGPFFKREIRIVRDDIHISVNGVHFTTIPAGFQSDGMSFPWWQATWDDPWHYRYVAAALLHDWLIEQGYRKCFADWLFEGALLSFDVSALEIWVFKNSVRTKR